MIVLRVAGAIALAVVIALAGLAADVVWDNSRILYLALGRDKLVGLCTPPAEQVLASRGFSPTDFMVGARPSISIAAGSLGGGRVLSAPFTFSDGVNGQRIDGHLVCAVHGKAVDVTVDVEATPLRAA